MRKAFVMIIALVLLLGISGCGSVPAAHYGTSLNDVVSARNIATAINAFNALNMNSVRPICDDTTFEDAKEVLGKDLWPEGLSDEDARKAWKLIVIKDGEADLTPEAQEALQGVVRDSYSIVLAINAYNNLYPNQPLDYNITLEEAKEAFWFGIWPEALSDEEESAAWELLVYEDYEADMTPEARQALQESSGDKSNEAKIANAGMIAAGINVYNALNPIEMLPGNATLTDVKGALAGEKFWPSLLTDAEVSDAWELIEIKNGVAKVKGSD